MSDTFFQQQLNETPSEALSWLAEIQTAAKAELAHAVLPNRKVEDWKYTSLQPLKNLKSAPLDVDIDAQAGAVSGLDAWQLVFVNGQLDQAQSSVDALEYVTLFNAASEDEKALIQQHLSQSNSNHRLFTQLHLATLKNGLLLKMGKNKQLPKPIRVTYIQQGSGVSVQPCILLDLEQNTEATLIEEYQGEGANFINALTYANIANNAKLTHYRVQLMDEEAMHIGLVQADLARDARYESFHLALGSAVCRNDILVNHNIGGSHSEISGVYVPQNTQHVDFHTCVEHKAAHCTSNEVFRGIMNDQAKAVFNGRIHIHKDAQKTLAELSNKNLLLTNKAEINTKPELEIYADDVRCAHGATVAQLEEKALFYLRSRGVKKTAAEVMLSFGFINELLDALPHEPMSDWLRPILAKRFGRADLTAPEQE